MAICAGELLEAGREILDPVLAPHGFHWVLERSGEGSGGRFVSGAYVRGNRRLELHSRFSLGLVSYSLGDRCVAHTDYMRVALAPGERSLYPGFSDDPLDGFRHLAHDVRQYASVFLSGSDADLAAMVEKASDAAREAAVKKWP